MTNPEMSHEGLNTVLEVITDKWATPILRAIRDGHNRFGLLQRELPEVSKKMLTQTLRRLERNGIIERIDYGEVPPRVEYKITPLGASLGEHITTLCYWGHQHIPIIEAARDQYDATQDTSTC